jgi:hypothetical protein
VTTDPTSKNAFAGRSRLLRVPAQTMERVSPATTLQPHSTIARRRRSPC